MPRYFALAFPAPGSLFPIFLFAASLAAQQVKPDSAHRDTTTKLPHVRVVAERTTAAERANSVLVLPSAIRTTPATNAWDIVRQTSGLEVHQQGQGPGFASNAVIRGFTSDHSTDVAIVIDGVPVNQPVSGHSEGYADWNVLFADVVSSIRVTKGPASPFIGNFAMGGEVEVQTAPLASGTRWSLRSGSYGDARGSLVTGGIGANGGWIAAADAQREDGWRPNSGSNIEHLLVNRIWTNDAGGSFSIGAWGSGAHWRSPGFTSVASFDSGNFNQTVDPTDGGNLANGAVRATLTRTYASGTLSSLLYARASDWHIFLNVPPEGGIGEGAPSQTEEIDKRHDGGGTTKFTHPLRTGDIVVGADYQLAGASYDRYFTTQRTRDSTFEQFDATYFLVAPFVCAHFKLAQNFSMGIGARLDRLSYASTPEGDVRSSDVHIVASPKLSAMYHFPPSFSAYAGVNGGFRSADGVAANPSLTPSQELASEIGLRADASTFEGSLAWFNVDVRHEQTIDPLTLTASADGKSRRRGFELDARVSVVKSAAVFTHATFNDAHYVHLVTDEGDDLSGANVFGVSKSTVEGGVDFEKRGVRGSVWAAYTGPFTPVGEPDTRTDGFTLLHVRATAPLGTKWSVGVGVQNILDTRYPELRAAGFVSPGQPRTMLLTLSSR